MIPHSGITLRSVKWIVRKTWLVLTVKTRQEWTKDHRLRERKRQNRKTLWQLVNSSHLNTTTWVLAVPQETLHWTIHLFARRTVKMSNLDKCPTDKTTQPRNLLMSLDNRPWTLNRNLTLRWMSSHTLIPHLLLARYLKSLINTQIKVYCPAIIYTKVSTVTKQVIAAFHLVATSNTIYKFAQNYFKKSILTSESLIFLMCLLHG